MKKLLFATLFLSGTALMAAVSSQSKTDVKIFVSPNREVYQIGDTLKFHFVVKDSNGKTLPNTLGVFQLNRQKEQKVKTDALGQFIYEVKLTEPGSIRGMLRIKKSRAASGVVVAPFKIQPGRSCPTDFDEYWGKLKKVIDIAPLNAKLIPSKRKYQKMTVWDLELPCPGSKMPVRGYFSKPKPATPKSLPAILLLDGAGVYPTNISYYGVSMLALHINAHGIRLDQPLEFYKNLEKTTLFRYYFKGLNQRDTIYFRDMYLRVYRALQFLKSQPEWDGKTLVVRGSSQGGAQAIVGAGLEPAVSGVIALIPALCDHGGFMRGKLNESGWPHFNQISAYRRAPGACAKAADYIDAVNFARNIKNAEVYFSTGMIDNFCPPSSVCAAFNVIPSPHKKLVFMPDTGHRNPSKYWKMAEHFFQNHLKRK